ncbi:MAG: hypothetical protein NT160_01690, partial [Actinobacteria bacterium]|nr:hypothetical protein [Actinomycetota bacterium]
MAAKAKRVALVNEAGGYVGPALARQFASRGHDLVLGGASDELIAELEAMGAQVESVQGVRNMADPEAAPKLVAAGLERFGHIDAAVAFSG